MLKHGYIKKINNKVTLAYAYLIKMDTIKWPAREK